MDEQNHPVFSLLQEERSYIFPVPGLKREFLGKAKAKVLSELGLKKGTGIMLYAITPDPCCNMSTIQVTLEVD